MSFALRSSILFAITCLVSGCAIYADGFIVTSNQSMAREQFAQDNTCPVARVSVAHVQPAPPPEDIAEDPDRAKLWNDRAADVASAQFLVSGCGKTKRYTCAGLGNDSTCGAY